MLISSMLKLLRFVCSWTLDARYLTSSRNHYLPTVTEELEFQKKAKLDSCSRTLLSRYLLRNTIQLILALNQLSKRTLTKRRHFGLGMLTLTARLNCAFNYK